MRVISQDWAIDVPYENSVVFIDTRGVRDKAFVRMQTIGDNEASIMAQYSFEEKAKKAMGMLREAWINETVEFEDGICHRNIIFQFPSEEELE